MLEVCLPLNLDACQINGLIAVDGGAANLSAASLVSEEHLQR